MDVDDARALADALAWRAQKWFFAPASQISASSPFASGIVVACFIEAAAEFEGTTLGDWLREAVPSSAESDPRRGDKAIADSFVEDVRHGLVHHARLNRGAEFSLDIEQPMTVLGSVLVVNPLELLRSVEVRWQMTLHNIRENLEFHHRTASQIRRVFKADFEADEVWESDKSLKVGRQLP
ncbi:MAG: hypothetical protein DMF94_23515 [Acidobacteria bacterium]|nr:MAG: hypothetical protein DMF94_23515 [Acidobacteriota bacterium]